MVIFLVTDLHIKRGRENKALFDSILKNASESSPDMIMILGDIFDQRESQYEDIINTVFDGVASLAKHFNVTIFPGNHDKANLKSDKSFVDPLRFINNVTLITKPTQIGNFFIMPHIDNRLFPDKVKDGKGILFCHQNFQDFGGERNKAFVDPECVSHFDAVYSGDLHDGFRYGNVYNICSAWQKKFGESEEKGFYLLDTNKLQLSSIKPLMPVEFATLTTKTGKRIKLPDCKNIKIKYTGQKAEELSSLKKRFPNVFIEHKINYTTQDTSTLSGRSDNEFIDEKVKEKPHLEYYFKNENNS